MSTMEEAASTTDGLRAVDPCCSIVHFVLLILFYLGQSTTQLTLKHGPRPKCNPSEAKSRKNVPPTPQPGRSGGASADAPPPAGEAWGSRLRRDRLEFRRNSAPFGFSVLAEDAASTCCLTDWSYQGPYCKPTAFLILQCWASLDFCNIDIFGVSVCFSCPVSLTRYIWVSCGPVPGTAVLPAYSCMLRAS